MAKISAVIITKNEEKNINRCLASLQNIVDEAVIMDSGSSDQTQKIVEKYSFAKFINTDWLGYAQTKNAGNSLATGDYILSLDADEVLSDELKIEILNLKNNLDKKTAYWLPRMTNYCGKWIRFCGWRPDYQMRLFPSRKGGWVGAFVHEKFKLVADIQEKKLKGNILHYSYPTRESHLKKVEVYSTLGAQEIAEKGQSFLLVKALIRSALRFNRVYILKLGILDGVAGFQIATTTAYMVFMKYMKARKLLNANKSQS